MRSSKSGSRHPRSSILYLRHISLDVVLIVLARRHHGTVLLTLHLPSDKCQSFASTYDLHSVSSARPFLGHGTARRTRLGFHSQHLAFKRRPEIHAIQRPGDAGASPEAGLADHEQRPRGGDIEDRSYRAAVQGLVWIEVFALHREADDKPRGCVGYSNGFDNLEILVPWVSESADPTWCVVLRLRVS